MHEWMKQHNAFYDYMTREDRIVSADIKEHITNEALRIVTGARRQAYGKPEQNFQRIATMWTAYMQITGRIEYWARPNDPEASGELEVRPSVTFTPTDVAAMMRLMKEARLAETPDHLDSYQDIVGYALCGAEVAGVQVPGPVPELKRAEEIFIVELKEALEESDQEIVRLKKEITELRRAAADQSPSSSARPAKPGRQRRTSS